MIPTSIQSSRSDSTPWLSLLAASAGSLYFFLHGLRVICGSELKVMEWLYDDSFYYLITAKHFSEQHLSSFDGVTLTTGYHPLWMWLCAIVYSTRGRLDLTYVRCCMALAFLITSTVLLVTLRYAVKHRRDGLLWALGLAGCSYSALNNGLTIMEWPLVVLSWLLLHRLLTGKADDSNSYTYVASFFVGLLGSLSRTDFGIIPASYLAAAMLIALRGGLPVISAGPVRRALLATVGAATGLGLVLLYNHRMTGDWLQGSAEVKRLAASLSSLFNPIPAMWQFARVLLYLPALDLPLDIKAVLLRRAFVLTLAVALSLVFLSIAQRQRIRAMLARPSSHTPPEQLGFIASLFGIAGYLILDGFNTQATYGWYTAAVTGFVLIVAARFFAALPPRISACIVFPLMLVNIAAAEWFGGNARSQMDEVTGGKALRHDHPGAIMAGGDVGKPSFYNNGVAFNTDGLMNNEVVAYLANGTIPCYILRRHIEYLSDIGSITQPITNAERLRLGKPPIPWMQYFIPVFPNSGHGPDTSQPVLYYTTDFNAIRASGECPASH